MEAFSEAACRQQPFALLIWFSSFSTGHVKKQALLGQRRWEEEEEDERRKEQEGVNNHNTKLLTQK